MSSVQRLVCQEMNVIKKILSEEHGNALRSVFRITLLSLSPRSFSKAREMISEVFKSVSLVKM